MEFLQKKSLRPIDLIVEFEVGIRRAAGNEYEHLTGAIMRKVENMLLLGRKFVKGLTTSRGNERIGRSGKPVERDSTLLV